MSAWQGTRRMRPATSYSTLFRNAVTTLDLDVGADKPYPDRTTALKALAEFMPKVPGLATPLIVGSGRGAHLHWPYDADVPLDQWIPAAWKLRAVCEHAGLYVDGQCGIDATRLLRPRPPGSFNRKNRNDPQPVDLLYGKQEQYAVTSFANMLAALDAYIARHGVLVHEQKNRTAAPTVASDLSANMRATSRTASMRSATAEWLPHHQVAAPEWRRLDSDRQPAQPRIRMSQGTWHSCARVAKFSVEGSPLFFRYSSQYKGYTAADARQRMGDNNRHRGVTCESLAGENEKKYVCSTCPNFGKINTPLHLGVKRIPLHEIPPEELQQPKPDANTASQTASPDTGAGVASDMFGQPVQPPDAAPAAENGCPESLHKRGYRHDSYGVMYQPSGAPKPVYVSAYWLTQVQKLDAAGTAFYPAVLARAARQAGAVRRTRRHHFSTRCRHPVAAG